MIPHPKFPMGSLSATRAVREVVLDDETYRALDRHIACDWGDVTPHDRAANDQALIDGSRIFSVYHSSNQTKFWIITEADRSGTLVLLPEDY